MTESDVLSSIKQRTRTLQEYRKFLFLAFGSAVGAAVVSGAGAPEAGGGFALVALLSFLARHRIGEFIDGFERELTYLRQASESRRPGVLQSLEMRTRWPLWRILKP